MSIPTASIVPLRLVVSKVNYCSVFCMPGSLTTDVAFVNTQEHIPLEAECSEC